MATDVRISAELPKHPKFKKLTRRLGAEGGLCLIWLFLWAAANRSDGDLSGMSDEDIELAIDWAGDPGAFVRETEAVGFLDGEEMHRKIHDWEVHNPWAAGAEQRSAKARWNAAKRHHGEYEADRMVPEYAAARLANSNAASIAASKEKPASSNAAPADSKENDATSNAPSPSPSPLPHPSPKPLPFQDGDEVQSTIAETASPVVVSILTNKGELYPVTQAQVESWKPAYPGVDIPLELQQMRVWAETKPTRRKTMRGMSAFITSWLDRQQDAPSQQGFRTSFLTKPAAVNRGFDQKEYTDERPPA